MNEQQLLGYINEAQTNPDAWDVIERRVRPILYELIWERNLGMQSFATQTNPKLWMQDECKYKRITNLHDYEGRLRRDLGIATHIDDTLEYLMRQRAELWKEKLNGTYLAYDWAATTLDFGCGSGHLMEVLSKHNQKVTGADVRDWRIQESSHFPFLNIAGNHTEAKDESFDQVIAMAVLNNSDDPNASLREIFRLAKKRVMLMESVLDGSTDQDRNMYFLVALWIDWFYNRVIHYAPKPTDKVPMSDNYNSVPGWIMRINDLTGFTPSAVIDYGVFQWLNPEHHVLLVYDK